MELSKTDAREIVKEISTLLNKKLNIMNNKGIIIASSDNKRINTFHEGAFKIINEQLKELSVFEKDLDLQGTYPGLNFPIEINGEIVGVVGITGNTDETRSFGNIVKKMTEILIEGKAREEEKLNKEKVRNYFLIDWISSPNTIFNTQLIQRGLDLNIDIQKQRRIICIEISILNKNILLNLEKKVINKLYSFNQSNLIFKESTFIVLATELIDKEKLNNQLLKIIEISETENAKIFIGISNETVDFYNIHSLYLNAKHALKIQRSKNINGFSYFSDLYMDLIYEQIPSNTKNLILNKVFANYNKDNLHKVINILKKYYDTNCSINKASSLLNMHPNTLQYHLNKIKDTTTLNPRDVRDSMIFQLAIEFFQDLTN